MKYKVIDEMCYKEYSFDDLNEAKKKAFNIQGVLIDTEKSEILLDYSDY